MEVTDLLMEILGNKVTGQLNKDMTLKDAGLDSLDVAEAMIEVEKRLNITFSDEELLPLKTVGDVITLIEKRHGGKQC